MWTSANCNFGLLLHLYSQEVVILIVVPPCLSPSLTSLGNKSNLRHSHFYPFAHYLPIFQSFPSFLPLSFIFINTLDVPYILLFFLSYPSLTSNHIPLIFPLKHFLSSSSPLYFVIFLNSGFHCLCLAFSNCRYLAFSYCLLNGIHWF